MVVERLEKRLKDLDLELNPLLRLKDDLSHQLATAKSVKFIVKNGITKSQVQRCDDEGVPYFGDVYGFGKWMRRNSVKAWCCWNGMLYDSEELAEGRMLRAPIGRYEDVPD